MPILIFRTYHKDNILIDEKQLLDTDLFIKNLLLHNDIKTVSCMETVVKNHNSDKDDTNIYTLRKLRIWYFTFVNGQELQGYAFPIAARDEVVARREMFKLHGEKWAFCYCEDNWNAIKNDTERTYTLEQELQIHIVDKEEE
jgi:hypothetical protein